MEFKWNNIEDLLPGIKEILAVVENDKGIHLFYITLSKKMCSALFKS